MTKIIKLIKGVINRIDEDDVVVYSAQASFYVMIATMPFITLLLSLAKYITPLERAEVLAASKTFLPPMLHSLVDIIVGEVYTKTAGSVISLSAVTALWTASRGVAAVARGVRRVYRIEDKDGLIRAILASVRQTTVFIATLLLTLLVLVFGGSIAKVVFSGFSTWYKGAGSAVMAVVLCLLFAFVYRSFAGRGARFLHQLYGAVFSTLGWIVFSVIFSVYIENFANYSYVYGSLAAIVLLMLWLYSCMIIFLFGAELNVLVNAWRQKKRI